MNSSMKNISEVFYALLCGLLLTINLAAQEKPALTEKDLAASTYYFDIVEGKLTGDGAKFLIDELNKNQYVLLGEYHNLSRIPEFTKAIIPIFDRAGCRFFGLEIGPVSSEILTELSNDPAKTAENLRAFNSRYYVQRKTRSMPPIPFFGNVEDAQFLAEARARKWRLLGFDQEFAYAYIPLLDRMFDNLRGKKKDELKAVHDQSVKQINEFYETDNQGGKSFYLAIAESKEINNFLDAAAQANPKNKLIGDAIRKTTEIYADNINRKYLKANTDRVEYMKKNLSEEFGKMGFDLKKDKMLLKMGSVHTGKGFSPLSLFELGNTLNELAAFNGNHSLHIAFDMRFEIENGKETDSLSDPKAFSYRSQALLQMAKKDQWTVIDLRPLRSAVFYQRKYNIDDVILNIFNQHDLLIIPKQDKEATLNIDLRPAAKN